MTQAVSLRHLGRWALPALATVAALELVSRTLYHDPDLSPSLTAVVLLAAVVAAAARGGIGPGLISAVIAMLYAAYVYSDPGQLLRYTDPRNARRTVIIATVFPVLALIVGGLRERVERLLAQEWAARAAAEASAAQLRCLQAVTDAALTHLTLDDLLAALLDRLRELLGADSTTVLLLDEAGEALVPRAAAGLGLEEAVTRGVRVPVGQGFAGRVAAERRVVAVEDATHTELVNPMLRATGVRALLGAPLLVGGRLIGVVHVDTLAPRRFGDDDARLLQLVADRMAVAIDHARLYEAERQARVAAEAAVRARDRFLSVAAHELRTPVTSIKGYTQLLRRAHERGGIGADRLARLLRTLDDAARRLVVLTDDLLDVSRIQLDRLPLRPEPLDLAALAREVADRDRDQRGGSHRLSVEAADRCWVVGDPARLEQVLSNLLDNAVKYSPDGDEVRLTLEPDGEGVLLRIRDEGIGLPPGAPATIFEPFDRAMNAERRHLPGLGLGLYICRNIVEQHGGRIWAESPGEGHGTTVAVWLPRCGEPEQVQDEPAGGHPASGV